MDGSDNVYIGGAGYLTDPPTIALYANNSDAWVGMGTTTPGARLEVNGNIMLTAGSGGTITFPDGTVQTTAFPGMPGGDFAESVDVTGDRAKYEPGDVLVIDPNSPGKFLKSFSHMIAGPITELCWLRQP